MEEQGRLAQGLPIERERFADSDDDDDSSMPDEERHEGNARYVDLTRARRVEDPEMAADGSKWPRPGR